MKCKFYKIIVATVFLVGILPGCGSVKNMAQDTLMKVKAFASIDAFNVRQVITKDSATSRTIMWQSLSEEKDASHSSKPYSIPALTSFSMNFSADLISI